MLKKKVQHVFKVINISEHAYSRASIQLDIEFLQTYTDLNSKEAQQIAASIEREVW